MAHFGNSSTTSKTTPNEWLKIGSQIGSLVNEWAGRDDLVAYVGNEVSAPVPALYNPLLSEIEVNKDEVFGRLTSPEMIGDLTERDTQYDFPRAVGAIYHEACHARFSRWDVEAASKILNKKEFDTLMMLEESRIESLGIRLQPRMGIFLESCALELIVAENEKALDMAEHSNTYAVAHLAGLVLSRIDAGVLYAADVAKFQALAESALGAELLGKLRELWIKAQAHEDCVNASGMFDLAREWVKLVDERAKEKGEETGEGGTGEGGLGELLAEISDAISDMVGEAVVANQDNLTDQQISEKWREIANSKSAQADQQRKHKNEANKVFSKGTTEIALSGSRSTLSEKRKPTSQERIAAVQISQLLEKAKYRERSQVEVGSVAPAGRLNTRAAVQNEALKAKGVRAQVESWNKTIRRHTDQPLLRVGVMVDISGSMGAAMQPMATTAWVMSEATKRVQGRAAMVYFGSGVFSTLRAGQHLDEVRVYTAPDQTEKFDEGFQALDGELDLLYGDGAKLLVVVSDGCFTNTQLDKARNWLAVCQRNGVAVVWITYDESSYLKSLVKNGTASVVKLSHKDEPSVAAVAIGKAAAKALETVNASR